ncbi:MAG: hypothetical protein D6820_15025 [Lentisphaerae bacterium]|nr:MAG: hypothetical protein D6820_15025 [Lentisphaerota bacterium]
MHESSTIRSVKLQPAHCAVDLGDGSERGEYVCQDYILNVLGRPHRAIGLMYCYYPLDEGWPRRASEVFPPSPTGNAWGYPYDDYFPYQGGPGGSTTEEAEPFASMRDIRRHGQDVNLTLTIDCAVPDEHLVQIARELKPFGRLNLRINHEATGNWFQFNKRYSYQEVADFFVKFHHIIKQEAPNIQTVLCIGGVRELADVKVEREDEFRNAIRTADIWSVDRYIALHWGWPADIAEPGLNNHKLIDVHQVHLLNQRSFERFCEVNDGTPKPLVLSEVNADGDVTGAVWQSKIVRDFYRAVQDRSFSCYRALSMYQFRDRGRLGLEQEDPNNPQVGIPQPLLDVYRQIIREPHFQPRFEYEEIPENAPLELVWRHAEDAVGLAIPVRFEGQPTFCEVTFADELNLMLEINGRWFYKAPQVSTIDLMPAFIDNPIVPGKICYLHLFAPPANGENDRQHAAPGEDWSTSWRVILKQLPQWRIRYRPTMVL